MRKKLLMLGLLCSISMSALAGSWLEYSNRDPQFNQSVTFKEQQLTNSNQERLLENQPPIKLDYSLERDQINARTQLWNDKYKIAYLYVFSRGGGCVGFFTIKGKVSSVNSTVSNPESVYEVDTYEGDNLAVVSSPAYE